MRSDRFISNQPVRIGQVGLAGGIGGAHLNEQAKNPNTATVAGCDIRLQDPNVAAQAKRITDSGGRIHESYEALLADDRVEAVVICTPHFLHRDMAVAAFTAGKHVLCEKPMATHPAECQAMAAAARAAGKVGAAQMQHVGRSSMLDLRKRVDRGDIGQLLRVALSTRWWREDSYFARASWAGRKMVGDNWCLDGIMFNQAIHFINETLILAATGPLPAVSSVRDVRAALYRFHDAPTLEMEDTACVKGILDVPGSPEFLMTASTATPKEGHVIELTGTKGSALWNGRGFLNVNGKSPEEFEDDNAEFDGSSRIYDSFAEAIRTGAPCITAFAEIGKTTQFIFSCYEAANWHIKKAPWDAHQQLGDVLDAVAARSALPHDLSPRPSWA